MQPLLDRPAKLFLLALFLLALLLSALGIHNSSISLLPKFAAPTSHPPPPLLGSAKEIRIDDWNHFTPALLYQLRRPDRLDCFDSPFGSHNAALLANLPTSHITTIFRPQFWPFFFLPEKQAVAAWWQFKSFFLVAGIFLLAKLLTDSSPLAIAAVLWFYFSSFTQRWFSTPAAMPEMVGLMALTTVSACHLLTAKGKRLLLLSLLTAALAINFILCLYLSFLLPLAILALSIIAAYAIANRHEITNADFILPRLAAILLCIVVIAVTMTIVYHDTRIAVSILAHTTYPGLRPTGGGEVSLPELASHLFNPFQTEKTPYPPALVNVCEAAGFFWLAPLVIPLHFLRKKSFRPKNPSETLFLAISIFFCTLLLWMIFPHLALLDKILLLSRVSSHRAILALGLANILLTLLYLAPSINAPTPPLSPPSKQILRNLLFALAALALITPLLLLTNAHFNHQLPTRSVLLASAIFSLLLSALFTKRSILFNSILLVVVIIPNLLINPIDRGFPGIDRSKLHHLTLQKPLKNGQWLVFSKSLAAAPFFSANGLAAFNSPKFIPDLKSLHRLDPADQYLPVYNQSGYLLATPLPKNALPKFIPAGFFRAELQIDPLDPRLYNLGIRYLAFDMNLDLSLVPIESLIPLADRPIDNYLLFAIPDPDRIPARIHRRPQSQPIYYDSP